MIHGDVVLAVDDNADVRNLVRAILLHNGFRVEVACDGAEGLELFHRHRRELCLVITDIVMPKMNGLELARAIRAAHADLPVLLVSGYMHADLETKYHGEFPLLLKPFCATELTIAITEALRPHIKPGPLPAIYWPANL